MDNNIDHITINMLCFSTSVRTSVNLPNITRLELYVWSLLKCERFIKSIEPKYFQRSLNLTNLELLANKIHLNSLAGILDSVFVK